MIFVCCQDLRAAFDTEAQSSGMERLLLSAAVSAYKTQIETSYEVHLIHQ